MDDNELIGIFTPIEELDGELEEEGALYAYLKEIGILEDIAENPVIEN